MDVGECTADSTGAGRAAAGFANDFPGPVLVGEGAEAAAPEGAGLGAAGVSAAAELAADASADDAADDAVCGVAGSLSAVSGALLVVRSTVTFRTGSGAAAGRDGAVAIFGFGPDNNSGTTSTTSATRIDAPISRSLTRRSITLKYIRDAPPPAAILWTRANRLPVPRYERIRKPRFDPAAPLHLTPRHRRSRRCPRR